MRCDWRWHCHGIATIEMMITMLASMDASADIR